jgi:hypothetical protein
VLPRARVLQWARLHSCALAHLPPRVLAGGAAAARARSTGRARLCRWSRARWPPPLHAAGRALARATRALTRLPPLVLRWKAAAAARASSAGHALACCRALAHAPRVLACLPPRVLAVGAAARARSAGRCALRAFYI